MKYVAIVGSRGFEDYETMQTVLDEYLCDEEDLVILCGMARGADTLGERWAVENGHRIKYYPAEWDVYGKSAGYRRNTDMAEQADIVVAFWDGKSKGTKHMIDCAERRMCRTLVVTEEDDDGE